MVLHSLYITNKMEYFSYNSAWICHMGSRRKTGFARFPVTVIVTVFITITWKSEASLLKIKCTIH